MKTAGKERRLGVKFVCRRWGEWLGPYSDFKRYSFPQIGRVGKWSDRRPRPRIGSLGWHAFEGTAAMRNRPPRTDSRRWFLVELEGPFARGRCGGAFWKLAGARCRFIREITEEDWNHGMQSMRRIVAAAKAEGLL